jgi:hypothetical protein
MNPKEENDPDTLQLRDETNEEWVESWRMAITKKKPALDEVTIAAIPNEKKVFSQ